MPGNLTRRVFLSLIGALPLIHALSPKPLPLEDGRGWELLDDIYYFDQKPVHTQCSGCGGFGSTVCLACDGTGLWSEASNSAGLYERRWAEMTGHCAWCNEWGRAKCALCDGRGVGLAGEGG
jgi:hypothetical protein